MQTIDVHEAQEKTHQGAVLIDIRDTAERGIGWPDAARHVPLTEITAFCATKPDPAGEYLFLCSSGRRSLIACEQMKALGYPNCYSITGGFIAWQQAGLAAQLPLGSVQSTERYARQLILPQVGVTGQKRLAAAKVAIVGAGGLGSPASQYLAAAGVGSITLIDDDRIARSNLQRQILYTEADIGELKIERAAERLVRNNPSITVEQQMQRLQADNARELLAGHDVIIDGADNVATRYCINQACLDLGLPWVYGAVLRFHGQISVFQPRSQMASGLHDQPRSACYACLFPAAAETDAPSCTEAGVLGVVPGVIGNMQANEALKIILGIGRPLIGELLLFDALDTEFRRVQFGPDPECPVCSH